MTEMITIRSALGAMCFGGNIALYLQEMTMQHVYEKLGKITFQFNSREYRYPFEKVLTKRIVYL